jgi:hypothetical protein
VGSIYEKNSGKKTHATVPLRRAVFKFWVKTPVMKNYFREIWLFLNIP